MKDMQKSLWAQKVEVLGLVREALFAEAPEVENPKAGELLQEQLDEVCRIHGKEKSNIGDLDLAIGRLQVSRNFLSSNRHVGKAISTAGKILDLLGGLDIYTEEGRAIGLAQKFQKAVKVKAKLAELSKETGLKTIVFADLDRTTKAKAFGTSFLDEKVSAVHRLKVIDLLKKEYVERERQENKKEKRVQEHPKEESGLALRKRFGLED